MTDPNLELYDDPAPEVTEPLGVALRAYNESRVGPYRMHPLAIIARDDEGGLAAGIQGVLGFGWLYIQRLWVAEPYRGHGLGRTLLERLESAAIERGARRAALLTASWQAPEFYRKCAYENVATFELFVESATNEAVHLDFLLVKRLDDR